LNSAFIGNLVAGVLSTGLKMPQMVYKGDNIVDPDTIFAHLEVPAWGQAIKVKVNREGSAIQKASADAEIEVAIGSQDGEVTGLDSFTVSDGDVFQVNITQVGNDGPNEGSGLMWGVAR